MGSLVALKGKGAVFLAAGVLVLMSLGLTACGSSSPATTGSETSSEGTTEGSTENSSNSSSSGGGKLIVAGVGFNCGLNDFAHSLCNGFNAGAENLPPGFEFELKLGNDYSDNNAFNAIIETSMQLKPVGLIIFPGGPTAQVPVLNRACSQGIKVIIIDNPVEGLECKTSYIAPDNPEMGELAAEWLIEHPSKSKEVGVVSLPPGEYASNDEKVEGFTEKAEEGGYEVVATATTDLSLDRTRTEVTNMLTAHPGMSAIFSANDQMGDGTAQAVKDPDITQLSLDGSLESVERIPDGGLSADVAQDPYFAAKTAVEYMAKAVEGKKVPAKTNEPLKVIDSSNVQEYIAEGGLR